MAWFACQILSEGKGGPVSKLPRSVLLEDIVAETTQPVDDLKIRTSHDGQLFLQCKRRISFSENDDELVSTFRQFAQQYRDGCQVSGNPPRALQLDKDRLVLAVSEHAPATIRNDLRELLDRIRHCNSSQTLADVRAALSKQHLGQIRILEQVIEKQLAAVAPSFSPDDVLAILRLVHVVPFDFGSDGHSIREAKSLLAMAILEDSTRVDDAWNLLIATVRQFSPGRSGADRQALRRILQDAGVVPVPAWAAREEIRVLQNRSATYERHVQTFSTIRYKKQNIKIQRPIIDVLVEASQDGSLLVTGAAGAGKSGCIYDLVCDLRSRDAEVLLIAVDQLSATSSGDLDRELQLPPHRNLVNILANWTGPKQAFLVVDALDAARTTGGLRMLCGLIEQIRRDAPRWRVVASIREFDLRHSRDVRSLFQGTAEGDFTNTEFRNVRHRQVSPLTDGEVASFAQQAPEIAAIRAQTNDELKELTRNPFNLMLLADLVEQEVEAARLSTVRTQIGLLDLYWDLRVVSNDQDAAFETAIARCVQRMVEERTLVVAEEKIAETGPVFRSSLGRLASLGVLSISEGVIAGASRNVGFVHNILFDYAVARVWLQDLPESALETLGASTNQDLLLAIRPSIAMAFERLWYGREDRSVFWDRAIRWTASPSVRLIGKIIAANVAATEFRRVADIVPLLDFLAGPKSAAATQLLEHTLQAAIAKYQRSARLFPLWGQGAPEWLKLAELLTAKHPGAAAWQIRSLLGLLCAR